MFAVAARRAMVGLAAVGLVVALALPGSANAGGATTCNTPTLEGPGPTEWFTDSLEGSLFSARFLDPNRLYYGGYGVAHVDGGAYENPNVNGCTTAGNERNYPADTVSGLRVRPKIFVSRRNSFARFLTVISNPGPTAATFTFEWRGTVDQDFSSTGTTSNGNTVMSAADRWATTCEDGADDGCSVVSGKSPNRAAELVHYWEGKGRRKHSADLVNDLSATESGDALVEFDDVTVGAGKRVTFMQVLVLARTIRAANKAAGRIDRKARRYGVFRGMSRNEKRRLQNWNPKQAKRQRRR